MQTEGGECCEEPLAVRENRAVLGSVGRELLSE